jgi:hypothetical protein
MTLQKYTGSVRGVTFGLGQEDYMWGTDAPTGLGIPTPLSNDTLMANRGSFGGIDRVSKRIIRVPITIVGNPALLGEVLLNSAEVAERSLDALKRAWRPSTTVVELDLRLSGPERRFFGRCRGLEVDVTRIDQGIIYADGNFEALEWLAYDTEVILSSAPDTSSPVVIPNPGTSATTRCVIRVNGNGGVPVLVNTDDPFQGFVRFRKPVANGQSITVNLHDFRIFNPADESSRDDMISPLSTFFVIEANPTGNVINFSGCASIEYRVRPAYL